MLNWQGVPLSEDYFVSSYSECNWDAIKPSGVCPDSLFAGTTKGLNNSQMLHSQQTDGKIFVKAACYSMMCICSLKRFEAYDWTAN